MKLFLPLESINSADYGKQNEIGIDKNAILHYNNMRNKRVERLIENGSD